MFGQFINFIMFMVLVKFVINDVLHTLLNDKSSVSNLEPSGSVQLRTLYITKEAQHAMLDLIRRARGKRVEYQLQLLLEDNKIYPGEWKWGAPGRVRTFDTGIGIFHVHPAEERLVETRPKIRYEYIHRPPELSQIDNIHVLVHPEHRIVGVAGTETYLVKTVPYGLEETADVQFAARIKEYPEKEKRELIRLIPMIEALGTPVEGLEEFYQVYNFSLGPMMVPIKVLM